MVAGKNEKTNSNMMGGETEEQFLRLLSLTSASRAGTIVNTDSSMVIAS